MDDYQNIKLNLCILLIYSCIRINKVGFICLITVTLTIIYMDDQSQRLSRFKTNHDYNKYAMLSSEENTKEENTKEENKQQENTKQEQIVTVNPRKQKNKPKNDEEKSSNEEVNSSNADTKRDKKPSPFQHSYEQRKRLLESAFLDLENTNQWKTLRNDCSPIRGKTSSKI